jgi:potassium-transporting ATPase KdpC subunit
MKNIGTAIKFFLFMTLLTGLVYPLLITGLGHLAFSRQADGVILERGGRVVGARMISQKFINEKYFWGRPSSIDYNPLPSGGSNLGPTSEALKKAVKERADLIRKVHGLSDSDVIPQDLLFASGSGLDPDIAPEAAYFQMNRVALARGLAQDQKAKLADLIKDKTEQPDLGFIGEPRVNVLALNLALDEMTGIPNIPPPPSPTPAP